MSPEQIIERFRAEFGGLAELFNVIILSYAEAASISDPLVTRPGVYVHFDRGGVVKVGRSFSNARKRALEHVRDNTGGSMASLGSDASDRLVLFTVAEDLHWVAALEVYFERTLNPSVRSRRLA